MANQDIQDNVDSLTVPSFSGGINTSVPATELANNECLDILNMEFDLNGNLTCRNGVFGISGSSLWGTMVWGEDVWGLTSYTSRITSIFHYHNSSGFQGILYTNSNKLYSSNEEDSTTDITGGLTFPSDTYWYWATLNGIAVGVNGATSGTNPVKVTGAFPGTAAALGGNPPRAKLVAVWNDRLWVVLADQPNQLQASDLGNPEGWNTDSGANPAHGAKWDIDKDDGDEIVAIYATMKRLWIFKNDAIHVGQFDENTNPYDINLVRFDKYANNIGCVSPTTVQAAYNDILFLSKYGIASIAAIAAAGGQDIQDFDSVLISKKVKDIQDIARNISSTVLPIGFVLPDVNQYWLAVPSNLSATGLAVTYVLDYSNVQRGEAKWTTFDGYTVGTAYAAEYHVQQKALYYIGSYSSVLNKYFIGRYVPRATTKSYADGSFAFTKRIRTKPYNFDLYEIRKFFIEWWLFLKVQSASASISISYFYDEGGDGGSYNFTLDGVQSGALWDVAELDVDFFDSAETEKRYTIRRSFKHNEFGKMANDVAFEITNGQADEGYSLNSFGIKYQKLSSYKVNNV